MLSKEVVAHGLDELWQLGPVGGETGVRTTGGREADRASDRAHTEPLQTTHTQPYCLTPISLQSHHTGAGLTPISPLLTALY